MAGFTIKSVFEAIDRITGPVRTMRGSVKAFGKDSKDTFGGIARSAGVLKGAIAGAIAAITTGAAVKALVAFAERGDDIARNAAILGLTAKAYQELSYAAQMADVDQEAFAAASKKLNANLGSLKLKTGTLYAVLTKTNPQLAFQLRAAKDTDEAFTLMADAIAAETNVQRRATLAQAAFGKSGQELIPMLEGLADARKAAQAAGAVISDEDVASASRLDDALKRIKAAASGPLNAALASVADRVAPIIEKITAWATANRELIDQNIEGTFNAIGAAVKFVGDAWNSGFIPAILAGVGVFKTITAAAAIYSSVMAAVNAAQIAAATSGATLSAIMLANPVGLVAAAVAALVAVVILLAANWDKVKAAGAAAWEGLKAFGGWIGSGFLAILRSVVGVMDAIAAPFRFLVNAVSKLGGGAGLGIQPLSNFLPGAAPMPVSPNAAAIESRQYAESRSVLDVNFGGAPAGTTFRQAGAAPGITINRGPTLASGGAH
jgi:hypothetical protein